MIHYLICLYCLPDCYSFLLFLIEEFFSGDILDWSNWAYSEPHMDEKCAVKHKYTYPQNYMWKGQACEDTASYVCAVGKMMIL